MNILDFWFENPKIWFKANHEDDMFITNNWGKYINNMNIPDVNDIYSCLEYIIIHDQVVRHVNRNYYDNSHNTLCCQICIECINNNQIIKLNPVERCFFLLPLRHSKENKNILRCLQLVEKWKHVENHPQYSKFINATKHQISKLNL